MRNQTFFRGQAYRELLDETTKEYGPGSLCWDAESCCVEVSDGYKLESPANYKDPFEDLSQFPFKDEKQEDGSVIKGSRHQRLRTVIGMFYKDRHNLYSEFSNLRSLIVERDVELRRYQNMWAREKEEKKPSKMNCQTLKFRSKDMKPRYHGRDVRIVTLNDAVNTRKEEGEKQLNDLKRRQQINQIKDLKDRLDEETDNKIAVTSKERNEPKIEGGLSRW